MMQPKTARIVGGAYAPFPIPWQVSIGEYIYPTTPTTTESPTTDDYDLVDDLNNADGTWELSTSGKI